LAFLTKLDSFGVGIDSKNFFLRGIESAPSTETSDELISNLNSESESTREQAKITGFDFGWTELAELINGRLAIIALGFGLSNEIFTGKSITEQLSNVNGFASFCFAAFIVTVLSLALSFSNGISKELM